MIVNKKTELRKRANRIFGGPAGYRSMDEVKPLPLHPDLAADLFDVAEAYIEGETKLEEQVRVLRAACEFVLAHECDRDITPCHKCYTAVKAALVATATSKTGG